jgi:hypothetical protein
MPHPSTGTQRLADLLLQPDGLKHYLETHRTQGDSFETIARSLYADTDGQVSITYTTVKRWLDDFGLLGVAS